MDPTLESARPGGGRGQRRVALVSSGLGPAFGGIGVVAQMMARSLESAAEVVVWRHHHSWHRVLRRAGLWARMGWGALKKPDLVFYDHVDLAQIHPRIPALRSVPYGVFVHGVEVWGTLNESRRAALLGASVVVANSANTVRLAREANPWFPEARVAWLGVSAAAATEPEVARSPVALIVGRMSASERYKGHDPILDGWPEVVRAVPDARLVVVGTGDDVGRLKRRVDDEAIAGVEFRGWVSDAERSQLYRSSRLFLFPSRHEGFGLAAVEAAAEGLPILGLRGLVVEELFPQGNGVVLVDEATGPQVASATIALLADPGLAGSMGRLARARVNATFLEDHFIARFRGALAPLLG